MTEKTYEQLVEDNDRLVDKLYELQAKRSEDDLDINYKFDALFTLLQFQIDITTKIIAPAVCTKDGSRKYAIIRKEYLERAIECEESLLNRKDK